MRNGGKEGYGQPEKMAKNEIAATAVPLPAQRWASSSARVIAELEHEHALCLLHTPKPTMQNDSPSL